MIDLRSDTVTRPTRDMLTAMTSARTGDDVYGEDPTVRALEEQVAGLLGQEAGLFTVTGSLANVLAVRSLVPAGSELLCEAQAHVVRAELGAHAALSGVTSRTWSHPRGLVDVDAVAGMLAPDAGPYLVSTAAVAVEDTHNFGGGSVQPLDRLEELRRLVAGTGVALHLDGARLWNAHVASGVALAGRARGFSTVSVSLSKGLGAPVGSVLVSSAELIAEAREWRKRLGGGWRQAGVLAAAGAHALEHHVERLADDHANARLIADTLDLDAGAVETNIVVVEVPDAAAVVAAARAEGVLVGSVGPRTVRAVTHLDVSTDDCRKAADVLARVLDPTRSA
ncbi:MAG: beta-eliminating lyase-related protein [Actinomycetota bacterium]|nr:beta-eliminating lyase-related protein [Actinomycetota bacterium]